jgi:hypothetical protein
LQLLKLVASVPQLELWTKGAAAYEIIQNLIPHHGRVRLVPWSIPDPVVRTKDAYSDKVNAERMLEACIICVFLVPSTLLSFSTFVPHSFTFPMLFFANNRPKAVYDR